MIAEIPKQCLCTTGVETVPSAGWNQHFGSDGSWQVAHSTRDGDYELRTRIHVSQRPRSRGPLLGKKIDTNS